MNTLFSEIKSSFQRRENSLYRLIVINIAVFVVFGIGGVVSDIFSLPPFFRTLQEYLMLPSAPAQFIRQPWTLITYMFLHDGIYHILFNMLFFYWFGQIISEYLGARRLTALYFLGGITGGLLFLAIYNGVPYYRNQYPVHLLGASGAVYAVVVAAATLVPKYTMNLLFFGPVQIVYIAGAYILISILQLNSANAGGNLAHLGGALLGFVFIRQLQAGRDLGAPINNLFRFVGGLFDRRPATPARTQRKTARPAAGRRASPGQQEIDAILDKINRSGYESLTREEQQILFTYSQESNEPS